MAGWRAAWGAAPDEGVLRLRAGLSVLFWLIIVWSGLLLTPQSGRVLAATIEATPVALAGIGSGATPPLPKRRDLSRLERPQTGGGLAAIAETLARMHGLPPELVHAVILAESRYDAGALSHKGAMGLMQLMPATARRYGVGDPWDPSDNIGGGVRYLRDLMGRYRDIDLVLAAYNAGEDAVARYGNQVPPFTETVVYVERVKAFYDRLKAGSSVAKLMTQGVPGGVPGSGGAVRLSGWGVIFGAFLDKGEARGMLKRQQGTLRSVMRRGSPAVVRRTREDGPRYAALLVGLKQEDAATACRHLWSSGSYCKALPPSELKDPNALWR